MANNPINMNNVRQIIKLYSKGLGKKKIALRLGISKNTVKSYVEYFSRLNTTWEDLSRLSDCDLNKLFHPDPSIAQSGRLRQLHEYFPIVDRKMRNTGMTQTKLWKEYLALHPDGYKDSQFNYYYKLWRRRVYPSMHIEHKAGDMAYVDFAGQTLPYVDTLTGEIKKGQVIVAILGASQYTYMEVVESQITEEFIYGCENSFYFFNGAPLALVPDNLKSAVFKANNYEPILNENFKAFAAHYGVAIVPARSRKPQDKAHVENAVKIVYQRIYTNLPEKETLPLEELNKQIRVHLDKHNEEKLTGKNCSRKDQWIEEQPLLQPLPEKRYEMRKIKLATVMKHGYVYLTEDRHYYSAPHQLIGKKLTIHYSKSEVKLYFKYELVTSHKRVKSPGNYTTDASHLAPQHRYVTEWNEDFFLEKARAISPAVQYYIGQVIKRKPHPQQGYKACNGILSFAKRTSPERLTKACERAHAFGIYNYRIIEEILTNNLDICDENPQTVIPMPVHENIRGGNYYQ